MNYDDFDEISMVDDDVLREGRKRKPTKTSNRKLVSKNTTIYDANNHSFNTLIGDWSEYPHLTENEKLKWYHEEGKLKFFDEYPVCVVFCFLLMLYKSISLIGLLSLGYYNINKFTYWNFTVSCCFYVLLFFALLQNIKPTIQSMKILRYFILITVPPITGMAFLVFFLIIIILALDDWLLVESSVFGKGELKIGIIHLGDWFLHNIPVVEILLLRMSGLESILRTAYRSTPVLFWMDYYPHKICIHENGDVFVSEKKNHQKYGSVIYFLWCSLSPILAILIYSIFFNPLEEYPTGLSWIQAIPIVLSISFLVGFFQWIFISSSHRSSLFHFQKVKRRYQERFMMKDTHIFDSYHHHHHDDDDC